MLELWLGLILLAQGSRLGQPGMPYGLLYCAMQWTQLDWELSLRRAHADRLRDLASRGLVATRDVRDAEELATRPAREQERLRAELLASTVLGPGRPISFPSPAEPPPSVNVPNAEDRIALQKEELRRLQSEIQEVVVDLRNLSGLLESAMKEAGAGQSRGLHPFVEEARRYAGAPYVWGGASSRGVDCSGLVLRVASRFGYRVPHSAAGLYQIGTSIARKDLLPGDLVFFRDTYKPGISHVGIFLGEGRFLHAARRGSGVIVSHLGNSPYREKYAGARRLRVQAAASP